MKRAFYEWGAISTLALTLLCFGYWAVSISTALADFETFLPLGRWKSMQILASGGTITVNDHRESREEIELLWPYQTLKPPPASKTRWAVPGLSYQSINW